MATHSRTNPTGDATTLATLAVPTVPAPTAPHSAIVATTEGPI